MFKRLTSAVLGVALSGAAWATTYTYVGPNFTIVQGPNYTTAMSITGTFTTAAPLPANMSNTDIGPDGSNLVTAWSFSDGVNTFTQANSFPFAGPGQFTIGTDSLGNVNSFFIGLISPGPPNTVGQLLNSLTMASFSSVESQGINQNACTSLNGNRCNNFNVSSDFGFASTSGAFTPNFGAASPPTLTKVFGAASIVQNSSTSLTFNVTNPNVVASLSGVGFTDTLPAGLVVSTPNGLTGSCGGGTITATAGSKSVSLATATLAGSASCSFSVNVTGTALGTQSHVTGTITSTGGGTGGTASASVDVTSAPPPPPSPPAAPIPAMQGWALALLALLVGATAFAFLRRRTS